MLNDPGLIGEKQGLLFMLSEGQSKPGQLTSEDKTANSWTVCWASPEYEPSNEQPILYALLTEGKVA